MCDLACAKERELRPILAVSDDLEIYRAAGRLPTLNPPRRCRARPLVTDLLAPILLRFFKPIHRSRCSSYYRSDSGSFQFLSFGSFRFSFLEISAITLHLLT